MTEEIFEDAGGKFMLRAKVDIPENTSIGHWVSSGIDKGIFYENWRVVEKIYLEAEE